MAGPVLYAVPYVPPAGGAQIWPGMGFQWTGYDESEWDLTGRTSGVALRVGARGFGDPDWYRSTSESGAVAGSRYLGSRALEREVALPVKVFRDGGSQAWIDYDLAFMKTMDPEQPGILTVTHPSGHSRWLRCRYVDGGDPGLYIDPSMVGWARYDLTFVAEQPFWSGQRITRRFSQSDPVNYYGPTGFGPPFYISEGSLAAQASIPNPGDRPGWIEWRVGGPTTTAAVGVGARVIEIPFPIADGRMLVIDTRPSEREAWEMNTPPGDGAAFDSWVTSQMMLVTTVNRTKDLGAVKFGALPTGAAESLFVDIVGSGHVRASFAPLYRRAF